MISIVKTLQNLIRLAVTSVPSHAPQPVVAPPQTHSAWFLVVSFLEVLLWRVQPVWTSSAGGNFAGTGSFQWRLNTFSSLNQTLHLAATHASALTGPGGQSSQSGAGAEGGSQPKLSPGLLQSSFSLYLMYCTFP